MGQASDTTADTMYKIANRLLGSSPNTINPAIVYIMIGTNNFGNGNAGDIGVSNSQQTMQGIKAIVDEVIEYCPNSKIVLTHTLPTRTYYGMTRAKIEMANRLIADELSKNSYLSTEIEFVDMETALTTDEGLPDLNKFQLGEKDTTRLHLNNAGYELWGTALAPFATVALNP